MIFLIILQQHNTFRFIINGWKNSGKTGKRKEKKKQKGKKKKIAHYS